MPMTTYPLDNIDYDASGAELFHCTRSSGIYAADDFSYAITGADNIITIGSGLAWIRNARLKGKVAALPGDEPLDMGLPDAVYPRIDAVVIRFDANANATSVVQKKGTPSSNPQPPEVVQTESIYELHRYHVRREVGAVAITAADITDLAMDTKYCGLMADSVTRINMDAINAQAMALIEQLRAEISGVKDGSAYVLKSGDTMTGPLNIPDPTEQTHAANKGYVDTKVVSVTLLASGWAGTAAPYTQTVEVTGLTDDHRAEAHPAYTGILETDLAIKEACAALSYAKMEGNSITFTCLEESPGADIPVEVEVYR